MNIYLFLIKIKDFLLSILLSIKCFNCEAKNETFCLNCIQKVNITSKIQNDNMFAIFDYNDPIIKKAIWQLKYHHKLYLGKKLGEILYNSLQIEISNLKTVFIHQDIYVIPVPLSKKRLSSRGYNQSEIIAKGFCISDLEKTFKIRKDIIYKKTDTIPQAKILNRKKRLNNLKGVFEIKNSKIVKNNVFIIIDDVITTGATVNEIMKILKKFGAKKVIGLAIAH